METQSDQVNSGRAPAPGRLALIQAFVNSFDVESRQEQLTDATRLAEWLRQRGLLDPAVELTAADHQRALVVREALRSLLLMNSGGPPAVSGQTLRSASPTFSPRHRPRMIFSDSSLSRLQQRTHRCSARDAIKL